MYFFKLQERWNWDSSLIMTLSLSEGKRSQAQAIKSNKPRANLLIVEIICTTRPTGGG